MPNVNNSEVFAPNIAKALDSFPKHLSVRVMTTTALATNVFTAGSTNIDGGSPDTIKITATGTLTVDGVVTALNDLVGVFGEATGTHNGVYRVTTAGASGVSAVLMRYDWFNYGPGSSTGLSDICGGQLISTGNEGTANGAAIYIINNIAFPTLNTTSLVATKIASTGEFATGVNIQSYQASSASSITEVVIGAFSKTGTITAAYYFPNATSTPAAGSNNQVLTLTRYNALGSSQGAVASATIANATPMTAFNRFSLGTISNASWSDGDCISAKSVLTGTATVPQGVWVIIGLPN